MNRSIRLGAISVFALLLLSLVPRASAQNYLYGIGDQTWGINIPIENGFINVANGQVHLEITLANHAQRGSLALDEALVYDSRIWQIVASGSTYSFQPTNVPNSMAGWRFVNGLNVGSIQNTPIAVNLDCYGGNPSGNQLAYFNEWFSWTDPSGSVHSFPVQTQEPVSGFCAGTSIAGTQPNTPTGSGYAADGSGYYLSVTNYTNATVFDTNGNEVYPAIIDRNGNKFTADANGNLVDTLGRTPVIKTTSGNYIYFGQLYT